MMTSLHAATLIRHLPTIDKGARSCMIQIEPLPSLGRLYFEKSEKIYENVSYYLLSLLVLILLMPHYLTKETKNIMAPLETCKQVTLDFIIKENDPEVAAVEDDVRTNRKQIICKKVNSVCFCNRLTRPLTCVSFLVLQTNRL